MKGQQFLYRTKNNKMGRIASGGRIKSFQRRLKDRFLQINYPAAEGDPAYLVNNQLVIFLRICLWHGYLFSRSS